MRGTFPSFLREVVKTNDHCVFRLNQEAKLVSVSLSEKMRTSLGGRELCVRYYLTGSSTGKMGRSRSVGV